MVKFYFFSKVADPANLTLPFIKLEDQYQMVVEKNSFDQKLTEEIREYYDGKNQVGIAINTLAGLRTRTISYYPSNQLLLIEGRLIFY